MATESQKIIAYGSGNNQYFGCFVSCYKYTLAIGAYGVAGNIGAVYIYKRVAGTWTYSQTLTASDGVSGDKFGEGLYLHKNNLLIGAPNDTNEKGTSAGAVYVFARADESSSFSQVDKILASDASTNWQFGRSIFIQDDLAIVGCYSGNTTYILENDGGWAELTKISQGAPRAAVGHIPVSIAPNGDMAIGNYGYDNQRGCAYVYTRSGDTWVQQGSAIVATDGSLGDLFGVSVVLVNDLLIVGSKADRTGSTAEHGSVYIFTRSGSVWTQQQKIPCPGGTTAVAWYGSSIARNADNPNAFIAGAPYITISTIGTAGCSWIHTGSGGSWSEWGQQVASDPEYQAYLGTSVTIGGDPGVTGWAILGAYAEDNAKGTNAGSAYVYDAPTPPTSDITNPVIDSNTPTGYVSDVNTNIGFSTKDVGGSGVDPDTINCTVNSADAIIDGVFQSGWDGDDSDISANAYDGYDVVIDKESAFGGSEHVTVDASCEDVAGNPGSLEWSFDIDTTGPVIDSNLPTGTITDKYANISFSTKDVSGSGVDQDTINCTVNGEDAIIDGVFQSGWDGVASDITANGSNGYDVVIDKETAFDIFAPITVIASCEDTVGNPASLEWDFDIEGIIVTDATAIDAGTVRITFNIDMQSSESTNDNDALNPTNYFISGGFRQLYVSSVFKVTSKVFNLLVPEMTNKANYKVEVDGSVEDDAGDFTMAESAAFDPTYDEANFEGVGDLPKFLTISNPSPGILHLGFSEELFEDKPLIRVTSYVVEPLSNAKPLFITGAEAGSNSSNVILNFIGGGSVYRMTVNGLIDPAGNYIDPNYNSLLFTVLYPGVDELFDTTNYIFDTNLGAVTMSLNTLSKRNIEDLVVQRTRNIGHDEQFKLISEALEDAGINRDDQRLKLFKG